VDPRIEFFYEMHATKPSSTYQHLPTLYELAKECKVVTEFGIDNVCTTWAFLRAQPDRLIGYDLKYTDNCKVVQELYPQWELHIANVLDVEIDYTDLLFIDTLHTYEQLREELNRHAGKVRKYIAMHDTESFGHMPEVVDWAYGDGQLFFSAFGKGLRDALDEFLAAHPEWELYKHYTNNHGLTIISRISTIQPHE
jgi:hypothetical protein